MKAACNMAVRKFSNHVRGACPYRNLFKRHNIHGGQLYQVGEDMNNLVKIPVGESVFDIELIERPLLDGGNNLNSSNSHHFRN